MTKKVICLIILGIFTVFFTQSDVIVAKASDEVDEPTIEEQLEEIDLSKLEEYFGTLSEEQKAVFGGNVKEFLRKSLSGDFVSDKDFFSYVISVVGASSIKTLPLLLTVVAIAILTSLIGGIKGKFASKSVDDIVAFAGIIAVSVVVLLQVFALIREVGNFVGNAQKQMEIVFPLIFTLMSALGATGSIAVYQPAVAILSFGITQLLSKLILPMMIIAVVFSIVGNLSPSVKMSGMSKFFSSASKWLLGTTFFLFLGFLSIKGITASVYDSMSVRTAKFALSKYIPVIGGYLSEGFNLVLAGSVLIKNAIGSGAVIIALVSSLPVLIQAITFTLVLKLSVAIIEPFSCERIGKVSRRRCVHHGSVDGGYCRNDLSIFCFFVATYL